MPVTRGGSIVKYWTEKVKRLEFLKIRIWKIYSLGGEFDEILIKKTVSDWLYAIMTYEDILWIKPKIDYLPTGMELICMW